MWVLPLAWEDPLGEGRQPTPVFLPGESHGQRSLAGCSPWSHKEMGKTRSNFAHREVILFHKGSKTVHLYRVDLCPQAELASMEALK